MHSYQSVGRRPRRDTFKRLFARSPPDASLTGHTAKPPIRPFFCQIEAVETAIWLAEVAPHQGERGKKFLDYLKAVNEQANPELFRIALKLATGAGKTTVIAMLIAWQTVNAVRAQPASCSRAAFSTDCDPTPNPSKS